MTSPGVVFNVFEIFFFGLLGGGGGGRRGGGVKGQKIGQNGK